jgi:broad specificity phosphatase PhoE
LWIDTHEFHYLDPKKYINATSEERDNFTKEYWDKFDPFHRDSSDVETYAEFIDRINDVILKLKK